jgi:nucleotide-binding universal stress UspA family protein
MHAGAKYLVVYDGTLSSKKVLSYSLQRARRTDSMVMVLSVFPAPLFVGYDGMHAETRARREYEASLEELRMLLKSLGSGMQVSLYTAEGDPEDAILSTAETERVETIFATSRYRHLQRRTTIPVAVVPGTLLLPVDSSHDVLRIIDDVAREAQESDSSVVVLGVIPVHLYSRSETREMQAVQESTNTIMNTVVAMLRDKGIEAKALLRSGYPDDEILRAAREFSVLSIVFPDGGIAPSELRKAAHVLLADREQTHFPLLFVPSAGGVS